MRTFIFLSSIALIYIARANPLPEIPLWTDSLPENTIASSDLELDDFSDTKLLFPASELFADFSDPLLETELFADSSDAVLHSSCGADDSEFQLYGKRDDGFCGTGTEVEPVPLLKLPDLSDLEASPGSIHMERPNLKTIPIPRIPEFSSDDDEFCPKPGRRLCCLGPLGGLVPHLGLWAVVHDCRDYGPWQCPARYDVCCQDYRSLEFSGGRLAATGIKCNILSENPNGIIWESAPGAIF